MPPLRERREDIAALAGLFLFRHARKYRKNLTTFDGAARRLLAEHSWPGNVRELDHAVERAVLLASHDPIRPEDLGLQRPAAGGADLAHMTLEEAERRLITGALDRAGGNVVKAARSLGLSRSGLYRRLEKFGLAPPKSVENG